ncbi:MAG: response regulator [Phycisphaeraceae bacterium]
MPRQKDVLTTGEVAKVCNVAPRTVSKWFDSGQLRGYRIPGSKDRRIPLAALIRFMKHHSIPTDGLQTGQTRLLVVDNDQQIVTALTQVLTEQAHYEVRTAATGFAAGFECEKFRPHVMLLDVHLPEMDAIELCRMIKNNDDLQLTKVIAMSGKLTDGQSHQLQAKGFDGYLKKPFNFRQVIECVEDAMAVVY